MISKISKLLTATLLLAVNFNNLYSMDPNNIYNSVLCVKNSFNDIYKSILPVENLFYDNLNDIKKCKESLQSLEQKIEQYNQRIKNNENTLLKNSANLLKGYTNKITDMLSNKKFDNGKIKDFYHNFINKQIQQLDIFNKESKSINDMQQEISQTKDDILKVKNTISKKASEVCNTLTQKDWLILNVVFGRYKDNNDNVNNEINQNSEFFIKNAKKELKAISELINMDEVKDIIVNDEILNLDINSFLNTHIKPTLMNANYKNNKDAFVKAYECVVENKLQTYYNSINQFNKNFGTFYDSYNIIRTINKYLKERKKIIDGKKKQIMNKADELYNKMIEERVWDEKEKNEINENVINENNINEENINNNDNDNNINGNQINIINGENQINNNEEENNINDNNINNQNNVNVVNNELLQRTVTTLVAGGNDEAQQYETFEKFCNYFFANNCNNIVKILINSTDDQFDYISIILNINNELQKKLINKYIKEHGVNTAQLMNNIFNIQSDNGRVYKIKNYISNIILELQKNLYK